MQLFPSQPWININFLLYFFPLVFFSFMCFIFFYFLLKTPRKDECQEVECCIECLNHQPQNLDPSPRMFRSRGRQSVRSTCTVHKTAEKSQMSLSKTCCVTQTVCSIHVADPFQHACFEWRSYDTSIIIYGCPHMYTNMAAAEGRNVRLSYNVTIWGLCLTLRWILYIYWVFLGRLLFFSIAFFINDFPRPHLYLSSVKIQKNNLKDDNHIFSLLHSVSLKTMH